MKKIITLITVLLTNTACLHIQAETTGDSLIVHNVSTGKDEIFDIPMGLSNEFDSLLYNWHAKNLLTLPDGNCETRNENPSFSDSVYADRLARIPSVMEMPYNDVVRKFIDLYAEKLRSRVSYMLGAANFYIPLFEEALDAYGLPDELKYLPVIESALNPSAVSRAGASGLWQFMLKTGKIYNLRSNSLIDERRDPIKSTYAAARYLKELYGIYGDWNLVIAAYNCGPGNINKAIRRADGTTDYWKIYNYLPRETRGYVPSFIAANYIMNYYCEHNICPMEAQLPAATDTLHINRDLHFQQIADLCDVDMEELRALNPQYKQDIIPGNSFSCTLRLPQKAISTFIDVEDTIYIHREKELFKKRRYVNVEEENIGKKSTSGKATYHTIRKGETLSTIARKYGTTVNKIKSLNGLRNNNIRAGKKLRVR